MLCFNALDMRHVFCFGLLGNVLSWVFCLMGHELGLRR